MSRSTINNGKAEATAPASGKLTRFFKSAALKLPQLLGVTAVEESRRNALAQSALKVVAVATPGQNELAVGISRDIQSYIKRIEEAGMAYRRPMVKYLALVKRTEDDHLAPLLAEKDRLDGLALGFAQAEKRRVAEEEERRAAEHRRLEAERQAEERRLAREREAREAEARRIQDAADRKARLAAEEAARLAAAARNKKQREEAELARLEAERKQAEADAKARKLQEERDARAADDAARVGAMQQQADDLLRQPLPEAARAEGQSVREVLRFEVVDIKAVYAARPELCKIEIKPSAVNAVVFPVKGANAANKDETTVPGLRLWMEQDLSTRRR